MEESLSLSLVVCQDVLSNNLDTGSVSTMVGEGDVDAECWQDIQRALLYSSRDVARVDLLEGYFRFQQHSYSALF